MQVVTIFAALWQWAKDVPALIKLPWELKLTQTQLAKAIIDLEIAKEQREQQLNAKKIIALSTAMVFIGVCVVSAQIGATRTLRQLASSIAQNSELKRKLETPGIRPGQDSAPPPNSLHNGSAPPDSQRLRDEINYLSQAWSLEFVGAPDAIPCRSGFGTTPAITLKARLRNTPGTADLYLLGIGFKPQTSYDVWERMNTSAPWKRATRFSVSGQKVFQHLTISRDGEDAPRDTAKNPFPAAADEWLGQINFFITDQPMKDPDQERQAPETTAGSVFCGPAKSYFVHLDAVPR